MQKAKTDKTPVFPIRNGKTGIFYALLGIVIYSQLFLSIFSDHVGDRAADGEKNFTNG
jgi:hypothetical protein